MDPFRNETTMELIRRKPGQLNILVSGSYTEPGQIGASGQIASQPEGPFRAVRLRYSYTAVRIPSDMEGGNRYCGDVVNADDPVAINRVIEKIRQAWADVQSAIPVDE